MPFSTVFGDVSLPQSTGITGGSPHFPTLPSGYDAVLQFSNRMLNYALTLNLEQDGLSILSVRVPYQSGQVSPRLQAIIGTHLRHAEALAGVNLEVVLLYPALNNLYVPPSPVSGLNSSGALARKRSRSRSVNVRQATADITWTMQVNLFEPTPVATTGTTAGATPTAGTPSGGVPTSAGIQPINAGFATVATTEPSGGGGLPSGSRTTLAEGTAVMHGTMSVGLAADLLQFWSQLNCGASQPTYQSTDAALTEFFGTPLAAAMLAQAVAPMLNGYLARISPTIALGGNLNAGQIAGLQLPALNVTEQVLNDSNGQVLALCASLGQGPAGASVSSFLNRSDFSCYLGERIFGPVLSGRWNANAIRVPIVASVPVQMPVSQGSSQTGQGHAQIQVNLSDALKQSRIQPSDTNFGDPLQLVSEQTVQLLRLWDPGGNEVTDLGNLANPVVEPLVMNLQLFDILPAGAQQNVQLLVQNFIAALLSPIYLPVLGKLRAQNLSGFTSSSLRALVVSWSVPKVSWTAGLASGISGALSG